MDDVSSRADEEPVADHDRLHYTVLENITDTVVIIDWEGRFTYVCPNVQFIFGYTAQQVFELGGVEHLLGWKCHEIETLRDEKATLVNHECEVRTRSGRKRRLLVNARPVRIGEGRLLLSCRDITELKQTELALSVSENKYRSVIEKLVEAIFFVDPESGEVVEANAAFEQLTGLQVGEGRRCGLDEFIEESSNPLEAVLDDRLELTGHPEMHKWTHTSGAELHLSVTASWVTGSEGQRLLCVVARNITEQREMEAQIAEMDRMIAAGTLAAGVGHEINNPLAYVMANIDYVCAELDRAAPEEDSAMVELPGDALQAVRAALDDALDGASKVRDIVQQLRSFTVRRNSGDFEAVDLEEVLESALAMAAYEVRHRARIVRRYEDVDPALGHPSRLSQVFLNLLINAAQAIPEGAIEQNEVRVELHQRSDKVIVSISDSGEGISPENRRRIYDPFFTTKPVDVGTGLGLSITKRIIDNHAGSISVTSAVGEGTTFTIELPAADRADETEAARSGRRAASEGETACRLFVIDDAVQIGRLFERRFGASADVTVSTSGAEALQILEDDAGFDVIFCDLLMPQISGSEFYREVQRRYPELASRIVFMTGGTFTEQSREFAATVERPVLAKPFDFDEIESLIEEIAG